VFLLRIHKDTKAVEHFQPMRAGMKKQVQAPALPGRSAVRALD
jgi:hypothetical protein